MNNNINLFGFEDSGLEPWNEAPFWNNDASILPAIVDSYKTENEVYKDFKYFIETALVYFSVTNWKILKLNQVIKTEDLTPCVFIQILRKKQAGSQFRKNARVSGPNKVYFTCNEVTLRFSATRRNLITDTTNTYNAQDILTLIRQYFQTLQGIKEIASKGYAQYRSSDIQAQSFTNDDEAVQLMPYFDITAVYTDTFRSVINTLDYVRFKEVKGV